MKRCVLLAITTVTAVMSIFALAPSAMAVVLPIPNDSLGIFVPGYEGAPATPQRIASGTVPQHPFMAPNGRSNIHNDGLQTDTYTTPGPAGRNMSVNSTLRASECASVTFDAQGRIITICVGLDRPRLVLMDPDSLAEIASYDLPARDTGGDLFGAFSNFSGGGYFYLDNLDRAVVPTGNRHLKVIGTQKTFFGLITQFKTIRDYDLTTAVPESDSIISALPDWSGRIWFITTGGVVGNIDPYTGAIATLATGEGIANSFTVDETGAVYVVTNAALYRFDASGSGGAPQVTWREEYDNSGVHKPGQVAAGSGTTPTIMEDGLVAIADNADPMKVVVMRRDASVSGSREVCSESVFDAGASATEQSLTAAGDSLVVENNYGYDGLLSTELGRSTTAGITKIDVDAGTGDCTTVWESNEISPSAVPKLSLANGLFYTYTKRPRWDLVDAWYFTAIDFCTGRTVYRKLAGLGPGYNNNFAPITLAPDGDAYIGVIGGLVRLRDGSPPEGAPPASPPAC